MKNINNIDNEILEVENRLNLLKEEKKRIENMDPDKRLAEVMHNKFCHSNHIDGCSWEYFDSSKHAWESDYTRNDYLQKARKLLRHLNGHIHMAIIIINDL